MQLSGKVALVTGGGRGIGAGIARRLAGEGADVAITFASAAASAMEVVRGIEASGRRALAIRADSADPADLTMAVERTRAELGRLDILVNNAGIFPSGPFETVGLEEIDRALNVHARGAFLATQAAVRHMGAGGRVVSIGSCLAERVPWPGLALYAMSKAALAGLTKGLARELGPRGITVNLVHPGPIDTEMNPATSDHAAAEREQVALGRFGSVDDIAATVAHLAGDGGRFITGATIAVDGGFTA